MQSRSAEKTARDVLKIISQLSAEDLAASKSFLSDDTTKNDWETFEKNLPLKIYAVIFGLVWLFKQALLQAEKELNSNTKAGELRKIPRTDEMNPAVRALLPNNDILISSKAVVILELMTDWLRNKDNGTGQIEEIYQVTRSFANAVASKEDELSGISAAIDKISKDTELKENEIRDSREYLDLLNTEVDLDREIRGLKQQLLEKGITLDEINRMFTQLRLKAKEHEDSLAAIKPLLEKGITQEEINRISTQLQLHQESLAAIKPRKDEVEKIAKEGRDAINRIRKPIQEEREKFRSAILNAIKKKPLEEEGFFQRNGEFITKMTCTWASAGAGIGIAVGGLAGIPIFGFGGLIGAGILGAIGAAAGAVFGFAVGCVSALIIEDTAKKDSSPIVQKVLVVDDNQISTGPMNKVTLNAEPTPSNLPRRQSQNGSLATSPHATFSQPKVQAKEINPHPRPTRSRSNSS